MARKVYSRAKEIDKGVWEYIKLVAHRENKSIPAVIEEMARIHAESTGKTGMLNTLKEDFSGSGNKVEYKAYKVDLKKEIKNEIDRTS